MTVDHHQNIRNFSIIAHIDHGKSTLADCFLRRTHTIVEREMREQVLDAMDLERERGITIKSHPVRMDYMAKNGQQYILNMIDTPGHVDFSYEVSRSLAACDGALLIIDAAQGIQAQTVANVHLAVKQGLAIIPVINKIDLPAANVPECQEQMEEILTIPREESLQCSAKQGIGIEELLEAIVARVPPPAPPKDERLRALLFDSVYNAYRGVVSYVRMFSGSVRPGDRVRLMITGQETEVKEVGAFRPTMVQLPELRSGEVGYIITTMKDPREIKIGDTLTNAIHPADESLPGFQEIRPMVFSGIYPVDARDYEQLKASIAKYQINDSAFHFQPETSTALGSGFRCGFLGLLHMEIVQERLNREYDQDIILTYPSVVYRLHMKNGELIELDNPVHMPDPSAIDSMEEPIITASIMAPSEYMGTIMNLVMEKRGTITHTETVDHRHIMFTATLPLHEIVLDFHDRLKTITRGYGSMDYEPAGYREADLVKLEILVHGESIDAFASVVHRDAAYNRARLIAHRLCLALGQQMFQIPVQGVIGGKVIARETVRAYRKDVTAKCYGGDISRKRKLLEKQKEGKKKMKQFGRVNIPQEAFVAVLRASEDEN
jgi:GTP-binding protein LepA